MESLSATTVNANLSVLIFNCMFNFFFSLFLGVHPNEAKTWDADVEKALKELLSNPECVALGQCGLDYSKTFSDPEEQKEVLEKQVNFVQILKCKNIHVKNNFQHLNECLFLTELLSSFI